MKILMTGSGGLVGSAIVARLQGEGHDLHSLVRRAPENERELRWDPARGQLDATRLEGFDAVVHLAGENIAEGRWTEAKMRRIHDSRRVGTRLLSDALAGLRDKPSVLVCASAIGYYGDRADEPLDEGAQEGSGFLPRVCHDWEAATDSAREAGVRVVKLRIGVVLSKRGGALAKMLLPFQLGLAGRIGKGDQWMSWIELSELVRIIQHALENEQLQGPVNAVSPAPVTNREYTKTLGRVLSRPTLFPLPSAAARLALGRMADELLLASTRVLPGKLTASGFQFRYPELEGALRFALGR